MQLLGRSGARATPITDNTIKRILVDHGRALPRPPAPAPPPEARVDRLHVACIGAGGLASLLATLDGGGLAAVVGNMKRIVTFDADGAGNRSLATAVQRAGIDPRLLFGYRVTASDWSIASAQTIDLRGADQLRALAALGYARLVQDALVLRAQRKQTALAVPPEIDAVIQTLPFPGTFTARASTPSATLSSLSTWTSSNAALIAAMMGTETSGGAPSSAFIIVDGQDLARQKASGRAGRPTSFYWSSLFVSELVREVLEDDPPI